MTLTDDAIERFENTAAAFYRATGVMAPGKDVPVAIGGYDEQDLRRKLFDQWCDAEMLRAEIDRLERLLIEANQAISGWEKIVREKEKP